MPRTRTRKQGAPLRSRSPRRRAGARQVLEIFGADWEALEEIAAALGRVQKFGVMGASPVVAEQWDQVFDYDRPDKADEAARRGVELVVAEKYL